MKIQFDTYIHTMPDFFNIFFVLKNKYFIYIFLFYSYYILIIIWIENFSELFFMYNNFYM